MVVDQRIARTEGAVSPVEASFLGQWCRRCKRLALDRTRYPLSLVSHIDGYPTFGYIVRKYRKHRLKRQPCHWIVPKSINPKGGFKAARGRGSSPCFAMDGDEALDGVRCST